MAGGGIGEAALIGAAFGGAKAVVTGEDPLKGALLGGAMGGVTGAVVHIVGAVHGVGGGLHSGGRDDHQPDGQRCDQGA